MKIKIELNEPEFYRALQVITYQLECVAETEGEIESLKVAEYLNEGKCENPKDDPLPSIIMAFYKAFKRQEG